MNQRIYFAVLMLKSSSNFLGGTITSQKCSENEALHEIGEVLRHAKDRIARLKTEWQSTIQFAKINVY